MPTIELIYDRDCPHADTARENLVDALRRLSLSFDWTEYLVTDPDLPAHAEGYGSPTVLVDGHDVAGAEPSVSACCRLYENFAGAPSVDQIAAAIETDRLAS